MEKWYQMFNPRQLLATITLEAIISNLEYNSILNNIELSKSVKTCLALALDKQAESNTSFCAWRSTSQDIGHTFGRQAFQ